MKKPQRLLITVSGDFAELIPWEIFSFLKNNYNLNSRVYTISSFVDDPEKVLEVRFISTDERASEISMALRTTTWPLMAGVQHLVPLILLPNIMAIMASVSAIMFQRMCTLCRLYLAAVLMESICHFGTRHTLALISIIFMWVIPPMRMLPTRVNLHTEV